MPSPNSPMAVARVIAGEYEHDGDDGSHLTLLHWRGSWMGWVGSKWIEAENSAIRAALYKRLEGCYYLDKNREPCSWLPNRTKIANLLESLAAVTHLPERHDPPSWLIPHVGDLAGPGIACANGLLDIPTRTLRPHTPRYFNTVAVPFDYETDPPKPQRWLEFLNELWRDDPDSVDALQEWFGYVLSGRTDLQKMLMLIGPTRSGKGTIARILAQLVGNVAGPSLASLGSDFGLAPLLGKPLAIISDARIGHGHHVQVVVERLLSISGEDILDVNRKYREPWTGKLGTRIMILTNELPQLGDESGAISGRLLVLSTSQSFLGRENPGLATELATELPGILEWSLVGLDRLLARGRLGLFTSPAASDDAIRVMRDLISPISAFVRECCEVGPYGVPVDEMWSAWRDWALDNGIPKGTKQWLGRSLRAAVPSINQTRTSVNSSQDELLGVPCPHKEPDGPRMSARYRVYTGIRLPRSEGVRPHMSSLSAHFEQPTHSVREAPPEGLYEDGVTNSEYADMRGQQICPTCDEPNGNHLPGCAAVRS